MRSSRLLTPALTLALASLLCGLLGAAQRAHAQTQELPRPRSGYYLSLGFSAAVSQAYKEGKALDQVGSGFSIAHRFGQLLTRHLGLGLRLESGGVRAGDQQITLAGLALEGQWEFATNLTLVCGVGPALIAIKDTRDDLAEDKGTFGAGYALGLSYDWFPWASSESSGGFAITPMLTARLVPGRDARAFTAFFGIGVTYWTGLPRDQLILPEHKAYKPR